MAVTTLNALAVSANDSWPSNFPVSAGSDRLAFFVVAAQAADPALPTAVSIGGQSMTELSQATSATNDVHASVWVLDEAGISAMSGDTVSVTGGVTTSVAFTWSVQGAAQTVTKTATQVAFVDGGVQQAIPLDRVADGMSLAMAILDFADKPQSASSNPVITLDTARPGVAGAGAGIQSESITETSNFTWTPTTTREAAVVAFSVEPAATGPSLTITDPIIPGTTTTFSSSGNVDPWTGARITDTQGNVKELTLDSQTSVSAPAVGDLAYALFGDVTIEVYNATESAEATIAFNPPAGFNQIALEAGFATDQESFLYQYGGTPAVPDQMAYDPIASDTGETLTLQANGYWTATGYGEWTIHSIDATDGYMEPFQFIWKSGSTPGNIISMRARRLKARANTAKPLRAR